MKDETVYKAYIGIGTSKIVQIVTLSEDTIEEIAEAVVRRIKEERNERMG